jgi:hypothetical protein
MSGMSAGGCVSGSNTLGTMPSRTSTATGGSTNATGYGTNTAAAYFGMGGTPNASMAGAAYGNNANTAAAYFGMGGYGVTAWSNPYAQVNNADGNSSGGFGAMNGMNDSSSSFAGDEFNLVSDQYAAALAAAGSDPTDTTPRARSRSTKSKSKLKRRSPQAKGTSH